MKFKSKITSRLKLREKNLSITFLRTALNFVPIFLASILLESTHIFWALIGAPMITSAFEANLQMRLHKNTLAERKTDISIEAIAMLIANFTFLYSLNFLNYYSFVALSIIILSQITFRPLLASGKRLSTMVALALYPITLSVMIFFEDSLLLKVFLTSIVMYYTYQLSDFIYLKTPTISTIKIYAQNFSLSIQGIFSARIDTSIFYFVDIVNGSTLLPEYIRLVKIFSFPQIFLKNWIVGAYDNFDKKFRLSLLSAGLLSLVLLIILLLAFWVSKDSSIYLIIMAQIFLVLRMALIYSFEMHQKNSQMSAYRKYSLRVTSVGIFALISSYFIGIVALAFLLFLLPTYAKMLKGDVK